VQRLAVEELIVIDGVGEERGAGDRVIQRSVAIGGHGRSKDGLVGAGAGQGFVERYGYRCGGGVGGR